MRRNKSVEYVHQRTILTTYIRPQLTILQAAKKNSFRKFKVVFIKILTNEPWILSVYRQIVTGYFSVCKTGYVSIYFTFTLAPFLMSLQISICYHISSSLLTYYRRYVCSDQFLSYQPDITNNGIKHEQFNIIL